MCIGMTISPTYVVGMESAKRKKNRWRLPVTVTLVAVVAISLLGRSDYWIRDYISLLVGLLGAVLIAFWGVFTWSRSRALKFCGVLLVLAAATAFVLYIPKIIASKGTTGSGLPDMGAFFASEKELTTLPEILGREEEMLVVGKETIPSFPQFLGLARDGLVSGVELDPDWVNRPPEELWRRKIGIGWSGFVTARGRAVRSNVETKSW